MKIRHWLTTLATLFLMVYLVGRVGLGIAAGDDPSTPSAAAPGGDAPPKAGEDVPVTKAQRDAWHKNIAQWKEFKEMEPDEPADNSYCNVCHMNLEDEKLVRIHIRGGVGCETCHGVSDKHSGDEDGLIPPEVMFPKSSIVEFCTQCHSKKDLIKDEEDHEDFFAAREAAKDPAAAKDDDEPETCNDCHNIKHVLKHRTRRWNKQTGELEWSDGVRMMQPRDE